MSAIEFLSQPAWQRLGFALLHFLWQGALIALLTGGLVCVFRLRRGVARYGAYLFGFAVMAACPVATYLWLETPNGAVAMNELPASTLIEETVDSTAAVPRPIDAAVLKHEPERPLVSTPLPRASAATPHVAVIHDLRDQLGKFGQRVVPWCLAAWLAGVLVLGSRMVLGVIGSYRWRRGLLPLPENLRNRIAVLRKRFGAAAGRISLSPTVVQPMVVGYLKPLVLLPASLAAGMPPELLEAVIAHELAHVRRFDPLVNLIQRMVETVLFYHPAIWWLSSRVRAEREICCDEAAVRHTGDPLVYTSALEFAGRMRAATARPMPAIGLLGGRRPLLERVRLILGVGQPERRPVNSWPAGLLAVAAVLAVAAMIEFAGPAAQAAPVDGRSLFGRVVDDQGEPVPGVEVSVVTFHQHPLRDALKIRVRTDQKGRFDVTAPLAGVEYYVMAEGCEGTIPVVAPGTGVEVVLTLEPSNRFERSGSVRTRSGEPVADATVVLVPAYGATAKANTDGQGRYRIVGSGRLGQAVMFAETDELISPYRLVLERDRTVDFTLGPPAGLTGAVTDQLSGKPIGGCIVTLKPPFSCSFARTTDADETGRFSLVQLPPGEYEAGAASETHYEPPTRGAFLERPEFPLAAGATGFREIQLRPMCTIAGRAVHHDGQPAAGAMVGVKALWEMDSDGQYLRARADSKGRFSIRTGRLNETLGIVSERGGFAQVGLVGAVEGETLDLGDVQLSGTIRVRGTVSDPDGKPLAGVRVSCTAGPGGSGDAATDDDGRFDLGPLALDPDRADSLPVTVLAPRHNSQGIIIFGLHGDAPVPDPKTRYFHSREVKLEAAPGKEFDLKITLEPAEPLTFCGRIVDGAGAPVADARVICIAGDAPRTWYRRFLPDLTFSGSDMSFQSVAPIGFATSDTDGKWTIHAVQENADDLRLGHYASQPDTTRYSIGVIGPNREMTLIRDITIEEHAAPKSIEMVLPERTSSSISGRVIDSEGQPMAGVSIGLGHMFGANVPISGVKPAVTDEDGVFSVPVDEKTDAGFLRIDAKGWSIQSPEPDQYQRGLRLSRTEGGFRDVTIMMARTGVVTGSVHWSSGEPVVDYEVSGYLLNPRLAVPEQRITGGDEFKFESFPPGDGGIWVSTPSGIGASHRVQLAPGESKRAEIVLPLPTCLVQGRLVDVNGEPAAGARVEIDGRGTGGFHFRQELIPNADGSFNFKVPAGAYTLRVRPLDQESSRGTPPKTELTVEDGQAKAEVTLTVPEEGWGDLIVEVVDKSGQPLAGVTVLSGGFGVSGNAPTGQTDDAGRFLVKGIRAGSHYIVLTDPARMLNENMRLSVGIEAGKTVTHRIILDQGRRVRGRVTCDGQPVNNVHVMVSIDAQDRYSSIHTGEDGVFQLLNVPDGKLTIRCQTYTSNQTVTKSLDVNSDRDDVRIELPTGRITGKILDRHGRLLKGCFVKLEQLQAYGDVAKASYSPVHPCKDGLINLPHLGDGQYRLTLQEDYTSRTTAAVLAVSDPIEIRNGKPVTDFVIRERE